MARRKQWGYRGRKAGRLKKKPTGFWKIHQNCSVCQKPEGYKRTIKEEEIVRSQDCYKCKGLPNCYC